MNSVYKKVSSDDFKLFIGGVSEKGVDKKKNQDAFLIGGNEGLHLAYIIVADGLGSCRNSDKGSKHATEIIETWLLNQLPKYAFLSDNIANILAKRLIEEWNASYESNQIRSFDTTVHLAVFYKGSLLVGGIGDGMALVSYDNLVCKDQINNKDLFSNVTNSMCSNDAESLLDFEVIPGNRVKNNAEVILATDGVSDDIFPDKKLTLPGYFYDVLITQGIEAMQSELVEWLENWETESHSDDKTICYLVLQKGTT